MRVLALMLLLVSFGQADTFDHFVAFADEGNKAIPMSLTSSTPITWTFAPHTIDQVAHLVVGFEIPAINTTMTAVLFVTGFGEQHFSWSVPGLDACGGVPCDLTVVAGMALPRFYGTRSGWMSFTFGDERSGVYNFTLMEPVPEPSTMILLASGLLAIGNRMRKRF